MSATFQKLFPLCLLSAIAFASCDDPITRGSGDLLTETRNVKDFHALEVNCNGDVEVSVGDVFKVEVTCEESIIDFLETYEDEGVLKIRFDRVVFDVDDLRIKVTAPKWDAFEINGSADVHVKDPIDGAQLVLSISGSGNADLEEIDFDRIKAGISGSGNVNIEGAADDLHCTISGSGNYDALDCPVKTAKVSVSGSGDARLNVSEFLNASVSGSGDVHYKGDPEVTKSVSGSGSVRKIN